MYKLTQTLLLIASLSITANSQTMAQGQDSTVPERDIMILRQIFPGHYDNANQAYFDGRLKVDEKKRHAPSYKKIHKIAASSFGDTVFWSEENQHDSEAAPRFYLYSLSVDNDRNAVRMKTYKLKKQPSKKLRKKHATYIEGCDLLWRQEAGQFHGRLDGNHCKLISGHTEPVYDMLLTEDSLWQTLPGSTYGEARNHFAMDKARNFDCYIDVPGVAGGRDIPFKRYHLKDIHDLGGEQWVTTDDGTEIGIRLFRVMWSFNNYQDAFARPSMVIYADTKDENGKAKHSAYSFTSPEVQRLGMNLQWALLNCHMIPRQDVLPFYNTGEPRL